MPAYDNMDFSISAEGLDEKGKEIIEESKKIEEALKDIDEARKTLDGWVSANKDKFENMISTVLPKMNEMVEVINLYGDFAVKTSSKITSVENKIANVINNKFFG